jgi:hypothetical protein
MKKIVIREVEGKPDLSTKTILTLVVSNSPNKAIDVNEMRKRVTILEALDQAKEGGIYLEEADHKVLVEAITTFPWSQANKTLLTIIDDVINAETVNISALKVVKDGSPE